MELLTASPKDAPGQVPRPVTVGVCSCGAVHGPLHVSNLSGSYRVRMSSSFTQAQTMSSALRCTTRPGVPLSQMLLCCCGTCYSLGLLFCRAFSAGQGNPYKLSVVPRSQVKGQEHWSISATGICHIDSDHAAVFVPAGKHKMYRFELLFVLEIL